MIQHCVKMSLVLSANQNAGLQCKITSTNHGVIEYNVTSTQLATIVFVLSALDHLCMYICFGGQEESSHCTFFNTMYAFKDAWNLNKVVSCKLH